MANRKVKAFSFEKTRLKSYNFKFGAEIREVMSMELTISDEKTKELLTEVLVEMIQQKREVFYEILVEALEDVGLANAIAAGRQNDFVGEDKIMSILED